MAENRVFDGDSEDYANFYKSLGLEGTYYLAFRDLPLLFSKYVKGSSAVDPSAVDHGCGAGRSTRFLKKYGYQAVGVDTNPHMVAEAKVFDPTGNYLALEGDTIPVEPNSVDLVLSCFVFLEIESRARVKKILGEFRRILQPDGIAIVVSSSDQDYLNDWCSFRCNFPENHQAKSGDRVKFAYRATDKTGLDFLWKEADFRQMCLDAGFAVQETHHPLATGEEPYEWTVETEIPCWAIYVLSRSKESR